LDEASSVKYDGNSGDDTKQYTEEVEDTKQYEQGQNVSGQLDVT